MDPARGRHEGMERRIDEMQASMCKTTSNSVRLGILGLVGKREVSVGAIANQLGYPVPTVSKHLHLMKEQGVVVSRRAGNVIFYRVADQRILKAVGLIRAVLMARLASERAMFDRA